VLVNIGLLTPALSFPQGGRRRERKNGAGIKMQPAPGIHFASENASFAPAASPAAGARRMGPVMIADLRKKFCQSLARHLTEKIYCLSSNVTQT
jgi:hypothetical protein